PPSAAKPKSPPTTKTTAIGAVTSQPNTSEHAALVAARPKRTTLRPSRSESRPIDEEATRPVRWKAAERYAASSTARIVPAPVAAKTAATKAGVQAHIPRS